jgi:hypothetical protein
MQLIDYSKARKRDTAKLAKERGWTLGATGGRHKYGT